MLFLFKTCTFLKTPISYKAGSNSLRCLQSEISPCYLRESNKYGRNMTVQENHTLFQIKGRLKSHHFLVAGIRLQLELRSFMLLI